MNEKLLRRIYRSPVDGFTIDLGAIVGISKLIEDFSDFYRGGGFPVKQTYVNVRLVGVQDWVRVNLSEVEGKYYDRDFSTEKFERLSENTKASGEKEYAKLIQAWRES
jgi:hypothetical protein